MTKNSFHKKNARALQAANPGLNFHHAMAALDRSAPPPPGHAWAHGQQLWVRTLAEETPTRCYLCGRTSSIVSFGDLAVDHGRVQMYCQHHQCDAREVEVIVVDDDNEATRRRSDVRILAHYPPVTDRPRWWEPDSRRTWAAGTTPHVRASGQRMPCLFCGALSCTLAPGDVARDSGRIRLRCHHGTCAVVEFEVLPMRDGGDSSERPDVAAIYALRPPGTTRGEMHGPIEIVPLVDPDPPADETVLQYRRSGPVPWE
ncbi:hypothetical protein DVS77_26620 [Mycolicibacterium moriokaense]|nr:hypothetical protein DVS77_26620 [Mycolicibacterium moriokaense]